MRLGQVGGRVTNKIHIPNTLVGTHDAQESYIKVLVGTHDAYKGMVNC